MTSRENKRMRRERQTSVTTKKAERLAVMDEDNYALNSTEIIKLDNSSQEMHWCIWNEENTTIRCTYSQRRNGTLHCTASSNYFKLKMSVYVICSLWKEALYISSKNIIYISFCHLILLFLPVSWPQYWPRATRSLQFTSHICVCSPELLTQFTLVRSHLAIAASQRQAPPSKLMVVIIWSWSDCLWEIADCWWDMRTSVSANIQMRSHIEWIYQDRRLSVIIAAPIHPKRLTISQDLMSYPWEFPWFLEIKFLLLIDERNFNQSSIWHFRSSNFSVAKTTQIPVCQ